MKGTSIRDTDFFDFSQPVPCPDEDQGSGTAFIKMGINELCSPLPLTKDYHKECMHRAKGVKVPTRPTALKVQVGWNMIEMFDKSTDVDFEFQRTMVDKLLSSHAASFVDRVTKSFRMKLELHASEVTEVIVNLIMLLFSNALDNIMEYTNKTLNCHGLIPATHM